MATEERVVITGNTYPVKEQLKELGGRWDPDLKGWSVPKASADYAYELVKHAPKQSWGASAGKSGRKHG